MNKLIIVSLTFLIITACNREELSIFENQAINKEDTLKTTLTLSEDMLLFSNQGNSKTFEIESNTTWTISELPEWLSATPLQGNDTATITITTQQNATGDSRNVKLTITAGELVKRIDIWQEKEQKEETIFVIQPGTLANLIAQNNLGSSIFLKITGSINYKDLVELRQLNRLLTLDLKDATIVEGERYTGQKWVVSPANCIDDTAFVNCNKLETIILPQNTITIGKKAFAYCNNLKNIQVQPSTRIVDEEAFMDCSSLTSITLPTSIINIERRSFANCGALRTIVLPKNIDVIKEETFANCTSLESFAYPSSIRIIETRAFANCTSLTYMNLAVENGFIGFEAFMGCSKLETITIPYNTLVEKTERCIDSRAFYRCTSLRLINSISQTPPLIGNPLENNACFDIEYLEVCTLKVPEKAISIYKDDPNWRFYNFKNIIDSN